MKARLGNILFTSFSGLALIIGGVISYVVAEQWLRGRVFDETDVFSIACAVALAVAVSLIGRACRYMLAGH